MMINSIIATPLLVGTLYLLFFVYRRVRIDLFRDKVFQIRRSLFIIAAGKPGEFFQKNSSYRYFERILNYALYYTEDFSLLISVLDATIRYDYAKSKGIESFDYNNVKNAYLKKIKSPETKEEVSRLLDDFQFHYMLFLMTRTFSGSVIFLSLFVFFVISFMIKTLYEENREQFKEAVVNYLSRRLLKMNKTMSNSCFALAASTT